MADTIEISLDSTSWTSLAASGSGFITNESQSGMFYKEAASQPADSEEGHVLRPSDFVSYNLTASQQVWARLKSGDGNAVVTPD